MPRWSYGIGRENKTRIRNFGEETYLKSGHSEGQVGDGTAN